MGSLTRMVRFVVGTALVAAGVTAAVPAATVVLQAWRAAPVAGGQADGPAALPSAAVGEAAAAPPVSTPGQWLVPESALPPPVVPRGDYIPPAAPDRLPPVGGAVGAGVPGIDATYRSALEVPPPPLLDAQSPPPPAAAWTSPVPPALAAAAAPHAAPSTHVVRDGDDLASIATRFYGHPAAATAVWDANRDLLASPDLLPIGTAIRLPPPWSVHSSPSAVTGISPSIEPPPTAVAPRRPEAVTVSASWLGDGPAAVVAPPSPAPGRAATVRVGAGETLETIAVRFYGDRQAALRIWAANRDRLRSPELAVPGMELRLP